MSPPSPSLDRCRVTESAQHEIHPSPTTTAAAAALVARHRSAATTTRHRVQAAAEARQPNGQANSRQFVTPYGRREISTVASNCRRRPLTRRPARAANPIKAAVLRASQCAADMGSGRSRTGWSAEPLGDARKNAPMSAFHRIRTYCGGNGGGERAEEAGGEEAVGSRTGGAGKFNAISRRRAGRRVCVAGADTDDKAADEARSVSQWPPEGNNDSTNYVLRR